MPKISVILHVTQGWCVLKRECDALQVVSTTQTVEPSSSHEAKSCGISVIFQMKPDHLKNIARKQLAKGGQ
jgi:hypothetical protein